MTSEQFLTHVQQSINNLSCTRDSYDLWLISWRFHNIDPIVQTLCVQRHSIII